MKLSTRARYGVRLMADLADHYGGQPVFLKDIAQREDISEKYLSIIVIPLRAGGLLQSIRGAYGGYVLARRPEEITVGDIIAAVEGKVCVVDCVANPQECSRSGNCSTRDIWSVVSDKIRQMLDSITLSDLVRKRREKASNNIMNNI